MQLQIDDNDAQLLTEALYELEKVKTVALQVVNAGMPKTTRDFGKFTEQDFGIPKIRALIERIENLE